MYLLNHQPSGFSLLSQEKLREALHRYSTLIRLFRGITMKKPAILINLIVIVQFVALIFNVGELKCQDKANMANTRYQVEYMEKGTQAINDDNMPDDKNIGVRIIEMIIKHNLNNRYQKLEPEELEEILEKVR
jgi:hypothetical protein